MIGSEINVVIGGMLHDIGKMAYRYNDGRNHSTSGHDWLKETAKITEKEILHQVKYHHASLLKGAKVEKNSLAYITYIADNIASMADRRKKDDEGKGFSRGLPLESIFNLLNGNEEKKCYPQGNLGQEEIVYPTSEEITYQESFYGKSLQNIAECLHGLAFDANYLNSLLEVLEANLSYIPSSTSKGEVADVSLFDHVKITAGIGACIYQYLQEQHIEDYHETLYKHATEFYDEKAFLLYSIDISGIQDFIYTISSKGALKGLRARSFYLEIIMEHIVDELLDELSLCRTNLIYCGGGHAYMLIPNTDKTKQTVEMIEKKVNQWFLKNFSTALYLAGGYHPCSANELRNEPEGSYKAIFKAVSNHISQKKSARYNKDEILLLNQMSEGDHERECCVCRTTGKLNKEDKCVICEGLERFSKEIQDKDFFTIVNKKEFETMLPLPNDKYLVADTSVTLKAKMKQKTYVRAYCKNNMYTGQSIASKMWVGDYQNGDSFEVLANAARGIPRLGVLRADIDNLGQAFVSGFESEKNKEYYVTLSRSATFSRKLSMFFKRHINQILEHPDYFLHEDEVEDGIEMEEVKRNATIVYSGGDDVFIVGAWDDIIGLAVDLKEALEGFTQGTLTISGGIGLYPSKFPISAMARQTGELEELSKSYPDKNAITLFAEGNTYFWDDFIECVVEDKYRVIFDFFEGSDDRGKGFLYKLLDFMRNKEDKINLARYAYLLARMEPDKNADEEQRERYQLFSKQMYQWIQDDEECRQAITAMYLYVYIKRGEDKESSICKLQV